MFDILLQVDSTAAAGVSTAQVESVWSLLSKGGVIMIPLGILFALVIYFFIERWLVIKKASAADDNFMNIIRDHITNGNVTAARSLAKNNFSVPSVIVGIILNPALRIVVSGTSIETLGFPGV
jgi:hypothetical protein